MALLCSNCGAQCSDDGSCPDCGQPLSVGAQPTAQRATKECPYCAETIFAAAIKCKHCGERLDAPVTSAPPATTPQTPCANHIVDDTEELSRQVRAIALDEDEIFDERSDRPRRVLPHVVLIALAALVGAVAFAVYHVNVVRPAGYYSWYDTHAVDYYLRLKSQRDVLAVFVSAVTLILGELILWRRQRRDSIGED